MKLNFRLWYEDERLISQNAESRINDSAVDLFVNESTQLDYCTFLVHKLLKQQNIIEQVHQAFISKNLLQIASERLGKALTIYDSVNKAQFKFYPDGEEAGNIWLRFPPVIFTTGDRIMLKSILIHELQHADDWSQREFKSTEASEFDTDRYLGMVEEARGLYVQLKYLLKRIGNVDEIISLLNSKPFGMRAELIPISKAFLNHFKALGEGIGSMILPLLMNDPQIPQNNPNQNQTSIVYSMKQEQIRNALSLVGRLVQMFSFSQYIRKN